MDAVEGPSLPAAGAAPADALPNIPWEDRPPGSGAAMWRDSRNPIIPRDLIERSNSIFNSAVVPFGAGFAGVFRVDDTTREMNLHAGRSADGVNWTMEHGSDRWNATDERVARDPGARSSTPTTRASRGSRTATT